MELIQLAYVSTALRDFSPGELSDIIEKSCKSNSSCGITGMLLYSRGTFLQVLEGPRNAVESTYETIKGDSRHFGFIKILHETLEIRNFPSWTMGFRVLTSQDYVAHPGHVQLTLHGFNAELLSIKPSLALDILIDFSKRWP